MAAISAKKTRKIRAGKMRARKIRAWRMPIVGRGDDLDVRSIHFISSADTLHMVLPQCTVAIPYWGVHMWTSKRCRPKMSAAAKIECANRCPRARSVPSARFAHKRPCTRVLVEISLVYWLRVQIWRFYWVSSENPTGVVARHSETRPCLVWFLWHEHLCAIRGAYRYICSGNQ